MVRNLFCQQATLQLKNQSGNLPWPSNMCDVGVMSRLTPEKSRAGRTAKSNGAEVVLDIDTLRYYVLLYISHVVEGSQFDVLQSFLVSSLQASVLLRC